MVGRSRAFNRVFEPVHRVAGAGTAVLATRPLIVE